MLKQCHQKIYERTFCENINSKDLNIDRAELPIPYGIFSTVSERLL